MQNLHNLPPNLPVPMDDSACGHLPGMALPHCSLRSTQGGWIDLADLQGWLVVYCYPMTGRPDRALPQGWDEIPGARGCTPQACAFRDHHQELQQLHARVFGLSTQNSNYQLEAATRLHLPFALLSDENFELVDGLQLPTFDIDGMRLVQRLTLIVQDGVIRHCFYPVFPPDKNSEQVINWLKRNT
jgi:peroxiredoxin